MNYSQLEENLKEVWNRKYPIPYEEILERDPLKKGISQAVWNKDEERYYLYNFLMKLKAHTNNELELVPLDTERNVVFYVLKSVRGDEWKIIPANTDGFFKVIASGKRKQNEKKR